MASAATDVAADAGGMIGGHRASVTIRLGVSCARSRYADGMPLTPDQLPDDIAALKRRLIAKDAELTRAPSWRRPRTASSSRS